jgi:hypothetical protein
MIFRPALLLLLLSAFFCVDAPAQSAKPLLVDPVATKVGQPAASIPTVKDDSPNAESPAAGSEKDDSPSEAAVPAATQFRLERTPLVGGAELLTIFGRLDGMRGENTNSPEVPLVSVVRDTLSDSNPENDRLRYVWMLTYARPNLMKRIASAVPFFYQHVGDQTRVGNGPPKPLIDLSNTSRQTWNAFFWMGVQNVFLDSYGIPIKAATRTYRQNAADYRSGHVMQALSILDNYENVRRRARDESELLAIRRFPGASVRGGAITNDSSQPMLPELTPAFSPGEMLEMRARLIMSGKVFGGLLGPDTFRNTVTKRTMASVDNSGHNWELLRQRAEAEGLYFEPLAMPDGRATHAMIWIARPDLAAQGNREFHERFLNIANPWSDQRLRNWSGYSRTFYFDQDNRPVSSSNPDARSVEMIPLAIYGLDHPKIPALLIDFRSGLNPKKREMSRRFVDDLTKNILSVSNFGNLPYFVGRQFYNFVTGRRGIDMNQPTRLRSYSELKLLLTFNSSIDPKLRNEIERRVQNVSLNPLNNNDETEVALARQQYDELMNYALRPDGLAARIERDRRAEMVPLKHGRTARIFFTLGNIVSFGRYVHRETPTPELNERMELSRRVTYHTQFLREVAKSSPQTDVAWDISVVRQSLQFFADQGTAASNGAAKAAGAIFEKTNDDETRRLSLDALSKMNNKAARKELLRLYQLQPLQTELRAVIAARLRRALESNAQVKPKEAKLLLSQLGQ